MTDTQPRVQRGWYGAFRDEITNQVLRTVFALAPQEEKLEAMERLVERLQALKAYDRWLPKPLESVISKQSYTEVRWLDFIKDISAVCMLPDGRIVSGTWSGELFIWKEYIHKEFGSEWQIEASRSHEKKVACVQALPDGTIVSAGHEGAIFIWTEENRDYQGQWRFECIQFFGGAVTSLHALPDGRILSGDSCGHVRIWDGEEISGGAL